MSARDSSSLAAEFGEEHDRNVAIFVSLIE
jgi:hypothetical protein